MKEFNKDIATFVGQGFANLPDDTTTITDGTIQAVAGTQLEGPAMADPSFRAQLGMLGLWAKYNYPTFRLTADLTAGLILSDPSKIRAGTLRFPYPAFELLLPADFRSELKIDSSFGPLEVEDVLVGLVPDPIRDLYGHPSESHLKVTFEQIAEAAGVSTDIQRMYVVAMSGGVAAVQTWHFYPDDELGDVFETQREWVIRDAILGLSDRDSHTMRVLSGLAINLVIYLEEHPSEIGEATARAKKTRALGLGGKKKKRKPIVPTVGRPIQLPAPLKEAALDFAGGKRQARKSRWVVRGHFREQAYGKGRRLRKRIWIQPHWAGKGAMKKPRGYDVNPYDTDDWY